MTTVYITKAALTAGIQVLKTDSDTDEDMITIQSPSGWRYHCHGDDWHTTPEAALAHAEEMRVKRIASLKRSLKSMESMTFHVESEAPVTA